MYTFLSLNKYNFNEFKDLNNNRYNFNKLNKDFLQDYSNSNQLEQFILRKKVKLLKRDSEYIGYIWIENKLKCVYNITSMYIKENVNLTKDYKHLIDNIKTPCIVYYECEKNKNNFNILKDIGFKKHDGFIEMVISLDKYFQNEIPANISFKKVVRGYDEKIRCVLQNNIFYNENRVPLDIEDIYYDEMQDYYYDEGSIFMKLGNFYIGYGQIILNKECPYIVNFGIIDRYRNKGYGKVFLKYLLNILFRKRKTIAKINVKSNNYTAMKLYSNVGFKKYKEYGKWCLKKTTKVYKIDIKE